MFIDREITSEINRILSALRASLDAGSYPVGISEAHFSEIMELYLRFEEIRFRYRSELGRSRSGYVPDGAIEELRRGLLDLVNSARNRDLAQTTRFRPLNMARMSSVFTLHSGFGEPRLSALDAIEFLIEGLHQVPTQQELFLGNDNAEIARRLKQIVPKHQSLAPVQFAIRENKICLADQDSAPEGEDVANSIHAQNELIEQGSNIIRSLERSNCDGRLIDTFRGLQTQLESGNNIIALGLKNLACGILASKFEDELPDAMSALLLAQTTGVGMYVAQFSEWQRFTENTAAAHLSIEDAPQVRNALNQVIQQIENTPQIATPEVPRTLKALQAFIDDPALTSKRTIFAIWRSVENLAITAFRFGADLLADTAKKTSKKVSTVTSSIIATAIITAALAGAAALAPLVVKVPESAWLIKAIELLGKQIR